MKYEVITINKERKVTLTAMLQEVGGEFRGISARPAVVVIPGGGYRFCSDREADPVAAVYLKAGYHVFILRYSVGEDAVWPTPLTDYEEAMATIDARAAIQNAGHADLVDLPDGSWYAAFLASRLIGGVSKNLGRETFLCPVRFELDWPLFTPDTGKVEWEYDFPASLPWIETPAKPARDCFDGELSSEWVFWGRPYEKFWQTGGGLTLRCLRQSLTDALQPMSMEAGHSEENFVSFVARRRLQSNCRFACRLRFTPEGKESAGIAVVQAMNHQYHLELAQKDGKTAVQLLRYTADYALAPYIPGFAAETKRELLAWAPWEDGEVVLEAELHENEYSFRFGPDEQHTHELARADGAAINPEKVGCMVGEVLGLFASANSTHSENSARFLWAEYRNL